MKKTEPVIAIVDDEVFAREFLMGHLKGLGYKLVCLESGSALLDMVDDIEPDVILLDVKMPGPSGFEVCRQLKESRETSLIPIVLVSGSLDTEELLKGLDAGADEFVTKPVRRQELRARIRTALRIRRHFTTLLEMVVAKEEMSMFVLHDLRTSLQAIDLLLQHYHQDNTLPEGLSTVFQKVKLQTSGIRSLADNLLLSNRISGKKLILQYTDVDLGEIIRTVSQKLEPMALESNCTMHFQLPEHDPVRVHIDVFLFSRIVENFLSNAFKFSPPKTTIRLVLATTPSAQNHLTHIIFSVIDEGYSIPPEELSQIFHPFSVASLPGSRSMQMGLGLTFCRLAAEAMNGRVTGEPNDFGGMTFSVHLSLDSVSSE